jgi:polyribonucleotide nucleotidyltransferase
MSKTTTKIKINHDEEGNVSFTENGKALGDLEISSDKNLEVKLGTGFSGQGAAITAMELFTSVSGTKGTSLGTWERSDPTTQPNADVKIVKTGHHIVVNDTNSTNDDDTFFFSVTATDGTRPYNSDPELKVRKTTN